MESEFFGLAVTREVAARPPEFEEVLFTPSGPTRRAGAPGRSLVLSRTRSLVLRLTELRILHSRIDDRWRPASLLPPFLTVLHRRLYLPDGALLALGLILLGMLACAAGGILGRALERRVAGHAYAALMSS